MTTATNLKDPVRVGDVVRCETVFRDRVTPGEPLDTPTAVQVEIWEPGNTNDDAPDRTLTESATDLIITLGDILTDGGAAALLEDGEANDGTGSVIVQVRPTTGGTWKVCVTDTAESGVHTFTFRALSKTS